MTCTVKERQPASGGGDKGGLSGGGAEGGDKGGGGGDEGGDLVFKGTPEDLVKEGKSLLSSHLKPKLSG